MMMCQNDPDIYLTVANMRQRGGSFIQQLAVTYIVAEPNNKKILLEAFQHYFLYYRPTKNHQAAASEK